MAEQVYDRPAQRVVDRREQVAADFEMAWLVSNAQQATENLP